MITLLLATSYPTAQKDSVQEDGGRGKRCSTSPTQPYQTLPITTTKSFESLLRLQPASRPHSQNFLSSPASQRKPKLSLSDPHSTSGLRNYSYPESHHLCGPLQLQALPPAPRALTRYHSNLDLALSVLDPPLAPPNSWAVTR